MHRSTSPRTTPPATCTTTADDSRLTREAIQEMGADDDLIVRMARRDESALGELYDRWSGLVYGVASRTVSPEDAEEILEDTFWQAWRQADRYRKKKGKVSTWLAMIARSRALDRRRSQQRSRIRSWTDEESRTLKTSEPCALGNAIRNAESRVIFDALNLLPREQLETVELAYYGGLSQRQIADRLDEPLGTIKTRARLAAMKLRERLSVLRDAAT